MNIKQMRYDFGCWIVLFAMRLAARIDYRSAPKVTPWAFTFEVKQGVVFNDTGTSTKRRGCQLLYLNDREYDRAFSDSRTMWNERGEVGL